jgi:N-acetylglucosaminyldiphosphoundecaprenol N-acetyl-beta-D-mannosaminyltransferase
LNKRLKILNVWVDQVNMDQALARVSDFVERGSRPHTVFAVNPEKNFSVRQAPLLYQTFRNADLLIPDGIGVVLAARILYGAKLSRVPGADLMENICKISAEKGYKVFIYGTKEEVSQKATEELQRRYPGLQVAGRAHGYLKEEEMDNLVRQINESGAVILFLALGSPKQEKWFATYKNLLKNVRVCQGVGGTLDTLAGAVKRAPEIWCKFGLEWLYRLFSDPKRLKRQKVLPIFTFLIIREWFKLREIRNRTTNASKE